MDEARLTQRLSSSDLAVGAVGHQGCRSERVRLHTVPDPADRPRPPVCVTVLSTSFIVRIGLRDLLSGYPDRITVADDVDLDSGAVPSDHVLLLDVAAMATTEPSSMVRALKDALAVVAVSRGFDRALSTCLHGVGIDACVSADVDPAGLVETIERTRWGATGVSGSIPRGAQEGWASLPPLEYEVAARIVEGMSHRQIAEALSLDMSSVRTHIRSAYQRMGVRSRSEAILWLLRAAVDGTSRPDLSRAARS